MNTVSKIDRMLLVLALLALTLMGGGCFNTLYMSTAKDQAFRFDRSAAIYVELGNDISVWEKNLQGVVVEDLVQAGFRVVASAKAADLVMIFRLGEHNSVRQGVSSVPETNMSIGYLGRTPVMVTTRSYRMVPYQYTHYEKGVILKLYNAKEYAQGKLIPVWEGFVVGDRDVFNARLNDWVRKLVEQVGLDYEGRVSLQ
jgi:hypothetical protein